jgi:two-component system, NtrC family, sensor histidine kinase PilS
MFSLDEKHGSAKMQAVQNLQTLIIGRLVAIFLLMVASWFWHSGTFKLSFDNFPQGFFLIFVISVGLTIVYFLLLRLSSDLGWQVRVQFLFDALLITWLIWRTGVASSPYITLYIVIIGVAGFFVRPMMTILLSIACSLLFITLATLSHLSVIEGAESQVSPNRLIQIVSFHVVAMLVVGLLSSRLSERHSSGLQLEEAERSLATLRAVHERIVESIRSGLVTTDLNGIIFTFNVAASEITGYRPDEVQGKPIETLFGDMEEQIGLSLAAAGDGLQLPRFEADLLTPDGFAVRIGYSISLLFSEANEATGLIVTFQDLTDIRSMEDSIRRKDRLAAVGRVAAGLAHEIRNPLGAMRGAIQVLESSTPKNTVQASLMDIILKESDRLNRIITNFLSYARPAAAEFAELDLAETMREAVILLRHSPELRDGHVIVEDIPKTPQIISADAAQLKQIFWNLARNAFQAMPMGGELKITLRSSPNNRIRITFEDTGEGMSRERVEQLFEPFSESTTGGTGLGLSIVYQIVKDHNGVINVKSSLGKGTTITIDLPRDVRRAAKKALAAETADEPTNLREHLVVKND